MPPLLPLPSLQRADRSTTPADGRGRVLALRATLWRAAVLGAACGVPAAGATQRLFVQVEVPAGIEVVSLRAEVDRLGEERTIELSDDGRLEADIPGDGVWLGELVGTYARAVNLTLVAGLGGEERTVFAGVLRTDDARLDTLGFRLQHAPRGVVALRSPAAHPGSGTERFELLQLVVAFGWGTLVMAWIALLVLGGGRRGRRRSGRTPGGRGGRRR